MFKRRLSPSAILSLTVLLLSVGVDLHAVLSAAPRLDGAAAGKIGFVPIGPRRYPPGYHHTAFAWPNAAWGRPPAKAPASGTSSS